MSPERCDFCQDSFPVGHLDEAGYHKVGPEWGWSGLEAWKLREVRAYATGPLAGTEHAAKLLAILDMQAPSAGR